MKCFWPLGLVGTVLSLLATPVCWGAAIAIANTQPLSFGSFVANGGGTVTVATTGARSSGGAVILIPSSEGVAAEFTVTGDPNTAYNIQLPGDGNVTLTGPGGDMAINDITSTPAGVNGQLDGGGSEILSVGGTLSVGSGQAPGEYAGSFTVIVEYQ